MLVRHRRLLVGAILVGACAEVPQAPTDAAEATLEATAAWGGSTLEVRSNAIRLADSVRVWLDATPAEIETRTDSAVTIRLPVRSGVHDVVLVLDGVPLLAGRLVIAGFQRVDRGPPLKGPLWPLGPGSSRMVGMGRGGVEIFDVGNGASLRVGDMVVASPDCQLAGIGTSYRRDVFVMQGRVGGVCQALTARRVAPTLGAPLDSGPRLQSDTYYGLAEVGPGRWFATSDTWAYITGLPQLAPWDGGGAQRVVFSPRGDRWVTDWHFAGNARPPVRDSSLAVAFRLPVAVRYMAGAVFSPGGDSLLLSVTDSAGIPRALMLNATTGALLAERTLEDAAGRPVFPEAIALDPDARWVYVAGSVRVDSVWQAVLVVLTRQLDVVTVLPVEAPEGREGVELLTLVPAPAYGAVFIVNTGSHYGAPTRPAPVFVFDRLPDP